MSEVAVTALWGPPASWREAAELTPEGGVQQEAEPQKERDM